MGVSLRLRAALAVLIALVPLMSDYTFAIVKDAPFLAFTVITSLCLVQVHRTAGASLARPAFALVCVLAIVGFGVTRNNGLPLVLVICGLLVLLSSRARTRAAVIAGIACLLAFTPQALVREHVGEQRFVEAVGVPLQMVGGTLAGDPTCVPEQAREYFDQIMPIGEWVARYDPQNVDRVKFSPPFRGDVLQDSKRTFLMMTARTFAACPGPMLQGYLLHTGPLWSTNSPPLIETSQSVFLEPVSNRPGNLAEMNAYYDGLGASRWSAPLGSLTDEVRAAYSASIRLMPPVGVWIGALLSLALVSLVRRRWDVALLVLPSLLVWATLLVAAPVGFQFRYVAYAPWILLIGAVMLVGARAPSRRPDAGRRARPGSSAAGRHVARR